jgi:hypothetical protein
LVISRRACAARRARWPDPVELGQDVVGEVEPPVREDVALDAAQDAERRQRVVGRRDLLGLPADVVGVQARDGADGRRVVADRDVVVAAAARGAAHLLDARASVRPRRVAVQVAADVGRRDERRRLAGEGLLAQLRRAPRQAERGVDGPLVRRVRQRPERLDVRRRPGRPHERGARSAPARRRRARSAPLDRHADRAGAGLLDHRDDLRERGEARQHGRGIRAAQTDREVLAGVAPAPHVAGRLAAERAATPPTSSQAR